LTLLLALLGLAPPNYTAEASRPADCPDGTTLRANLERTVDELTALGPRHNGTPQAYARAAALIAHRLTALGLPFETLTRPAAPDGPPVLVASLGGTDADPTLLFCAHYDTVHGSPGACDNAAGVAVLLELARLLATAPTLPGLRIAFFPDEEEPNFMTARSGSVFYAELLAARGVRPGRVITMDALGATAPSTGPAALPGVASGAVVIGARKASGALALALVSELNVFQPTEAVISDAGAQWIDRSDHAPFAARGWQAVLATSPGVAFAPCLHKPCDLPASIDFTVLKNTACGLINYIAHMQGGQP